MRYVTSKEAKSVLGICSGTLRRYRKEGRIQAVKTPGGHYRWAIPTEFQSPSVIGQKRAVCYVRVSSAKQRDDLERQATYMSSKFPDREIIRDIGSGINFKRRGLLSLLERVKTGNIQEVAVASRDRLCRFAFELLEWYFKQYNVRLVVLDNNDQSPERELSDDLLSIVQVFCCRRNGRRRYKISDDETNDQDPDQALQGTET